MSKILSGRPTITAGAGVALLAANATGNSWLYHDRSLPWVIVAAQAVHVYYEIKAAKPSRATTHGAASAIFLLVLQCMHYNRDAEISDDTTSAVFCIWLSAVLLIMFMSVPRGNDEFRNGFPVDRQNTASIIELLTFIWPRQVFNLDRISKENSEALPVLPTSLQTATLAESHRQWTRKVASHKIVFILVREYAGPLLLQSSLAVLNAVALLGPNLVTYQWLQHLSDDEVRGSSDSLRFAVILGVSKALPALISAWMTWVGSSMIYLPMRSTLSALIYKKILSLPTTAENTDATGAQSKGTWLQASALSIRACHWISNCGVVVGLLTQICFTTAALVTLVGWQSVAIAIAAVLLTMPLITYMMERWTTLLIRNWGLARDRSNVLQRALLAIRHIKLTATEDFWKQKIYKVRQKELDGYTKIAWLLFWKGIVGNISPAILSGIPIYIYAWQGHTLTPSLAFTFLNLFKELQAKLWEIPQNISPLRAGWASAKELDQFLRKEETCEPQFISSDTFSLHNATIAWGSAAGEKDMFKLENVNAAFPTGELSIITGKTGCGKSLLLAALASEAKILSGDIGRPLLSNHEYSKETPTEEWIEPNTCALVSQNPWMDNATIQDNILFGLPMDAKRYAHVLYCCVLDQDLKKFKDGDLTVISIKGVSLSGGQRARIALARALYSRASCLLMDDVLSAVDAEVRTWIVEKALCGSLAHGRTRVLVTHHEKQIASKTSYRLLIQDGTATGEPLSRDSAFNAAKQTEKPISVDDGFNYEKYLQKQNRACEKETSTKTSSSVQGTAEQSFRIAPYIMYFRISGGIKSWLLVLVSFAICEWNRRSASLRFEEWVSAKDEQTGAANIYLSPAQAYMLMSALTTVTSSIRGLIMFNVYRIASQKLFCQMTERIFGAPLQWAESASQGEILQAYDRSMRNVDEDVTYAISGFLALVSQLATFLWLSVTISWYETPLMMVLFCMIFNVGKNLIPVKKHLTAIELKTSSLILQHRSALYAPDGISTVRAYGMKDSFCQRANEMFDKSASATWHSILHGVASEFQLGVLGAVYVSLSCYSIAVSGGGAGAAGTALSLAIQLSETVSGLVQRISAVDTGLVAAGKLNEYGSVEQEPSAGVDVPPSWPEEGRLEVCDYVAGYGPGLPNTLHGLNLSIQPGERVGVVGRTGAGKSTLALSLARLIEKRGGAICIDSVDIAHVKPQVLRKRIFIIPQDPYISGGTLRAVLDPHDAHSDDELVALLERCRFFPTTTNSETGDSSLSYAVSDGGANLSQGQRQILCLVQAILSQRKVVIMDEATSAVDMETDSTIQSMIRDGLQNATVVVIAHRLATIAHLDKVLVIDDGKAVEFGKPVELYRQGGLFCSLVNHSVDKDDLVRAFSEN